MFLIAVLMIAAAPVALAVQEMPGRDRPNFSGTWILLEGEADTKETMAVEHTSTDLIVQTSVSGAKPLRVVYRLDGTESVNTVGRVTMTSSVSWEGSSLDIRTTRVTKGPTGENQFETRERWTLQDDATLVLRRTTQGAKGQQESRLRFRRK
jgi:hypothetical protein